MEKDYKKGIVFGILITVITIGSVFLILFVTNVWNFSSKNDINTTTVEGENYNGNNQIEEKSNNKEDENITEQTTTKVVNKNVITKEMLVGTYKGIKNYTNQYGNAIKLDVTLVLKADGTATYDAADGDGNEATKGTYKYENNKIIYTKEYFNYPNNSSKFEEESRPKIESFVVIDKNTLQITFNNQKMELKRNGTENKQMILKLVGTYKYIYSFTQNDVTEDSGCKTITLSETLELKNDGTFSYNRGATCSGGETATGTYYVENNVLYLYNNDCTQGDNCRTSIVLPYTEKSGVISITDNNSTSGWKSNSTWGSTKLPETILQKVN